MGFVIFVILIIAMLYLVFFASLSAKILGIIGEREVRKKLKKLDKNRYTIFNDVVFDIKGKSSQIDHIIVSDYGIFVIETKNYKGSIYGSEYNEYWTQYLYKKKFKLYNPIKQNQGHIYAMHYVLKGLLPIDFYSIIVFTERADLKIKSNTPVIYSNRLLKVFKTYDKVKLNIYMKQAIIDTINKHNLNSNK